MDLQEAAFLLTWVNSHFSFLAQTLCRLSFNAYAAAMFGQMGGGVGGMGGGAPTSNIPPEQRYATQACTFGCDYVIITILV